MNSNSTRLGFFLFGIVCLIGYVFILTLFQETIVRSDTTTILATRPIDPRDLLRGEYVILRYAIEDEVEDWIDLSEFSHGDFVYVELSETSDGIAYVNDVRQRRLAGLEGLWIRGTIERGSVRFTDIEQYYLPEGTGRSIEQLGSNLHVRVALENGNARVLELLDGDLEPVDPHTFDQLEDE